MVSPCVRLSGESDDGEDWTLTVVRVGGASGLLVGWAKCRALGGSGSLGGLSSGNGFKSLGGMLSTRWWVLYGQLLVSILRVYEILL